MTKYKVLNVKLSNSPLNKLTEVILNLLSKLNGNSNDETNFPYNLLLTDTQVSEDLQRFCKWLIS